LHVHQVYSRDGHWRCIRDDKGRIVVAICHNMDLGDGWENLDDSWRIFDVRPDRQLRGFIRVAIDGIRKHHTELVFALKDVGSQRARPW
jgi:hypothetical protein